MKYDHQTIDKKKQHRFPVMRVCSTTEIEQQLVASNVWPPYLGLAIYNIDIPYSL